MHGKRTFSESFYHFHGDHQFILSGKKGFANLESLQGASLLVIKSAVYKIQNDSENATG
jgi:hypothetical protein